MTAAHLIIGECAAYLLTDSATYRPDGTVIDLRPKVITSTELRLAVCGNGETWEAKPSLIKRWLSEQPSADAAIEALPSLVAILRADFEALYARHGLPCPLHDSDAWPPRMFNLFVAIWSEGRQQPEGYAISSRGSAFYGYLEKVLSGGVCRVKAHIQPPAELVFDPNHAERDGLALLEVQRRYAMPDGTYIVGGTAQLTTVNEAGVLTTVLRQWSDGIGQRINPIAEVQ